MHVIAIFLFLHLSLHHMLVFYESGCKYCQLFCHLIVVGSSYWFSLSFRFNGHFPGEPGLAGFIGAKDNGSGGNSWNGVVEFNVLLDTV